MIDIQNFNKTNFLEYSEQLKKEFNPLDVQKTTWIKTKNPTYTSFLIALKKTRYLDIPGEQAKTKVYEYYKRPMSCKKCFQYGYTLKRYDLTV